jgi:hypothetical protein
MTPTPSPRPQASHQASSAPAYSVAPGSALAYGTLAQSHAAGVEPWAIWWSSALAASSSAARSPLNAYQSTAESASIA